MIKNIIFDWSGTLSDDLTPVYKVAMIIFDHWNTKRTSKEEFRREFRLPYMKFYNKYIPKINHKQQTQMFEKLIYEVGEPKPFREYSR